MSDMRTLVRALIVCVLFVAMIPLLPFAFVAFCVWAIVRSSRPALSHY